MGPPTYHTDGELPKIENTTPEAAAAHQSLQGADEQPSDPGSTRRPKKVPRMDMPRCPPDDFPKIENATSRAVDVHRPLQAQRHPPSGRGLGLLDLPPEVRLMIYKHVLELQPLLISQNRLPKVKPKVKSYQVQTIYSSTLIRDRPRIGTETRLDCDPMKIIQRDGPPTESHMFSPRRPQGYFPVGILGVCRQIYAEIRALPFNMNDWAFCSREIEDTGLVAASLFTRTLVPWQRDAMRWARINVGWGDFTDPERLDQWEELCGFWGAGLRGLRIHVSHVSDMSRSVIELLPRASVWREPWILGDLAEWRWVDRGLRRLRRLKTLEVEWVGRPRQKVPKEGKLTWCEKVSERLNQGRDECDRTAVVAVKGVPQFPRPWDD